MSSGSIQHFSEKPAVTLDKAAHLRKAMDHVVKYVGEHLSKRSLKPCRISILCLMPKGLDHYLIKSSENYLFEQIYRKNNEIAGGKHIIDEETRKPKYELNVKPYVELVNGSNWLAEQTNEDLIRAEISKDLRYVFKMSESNSGIQVYRLNSEELVEYFNPEKATIN